MQTLPKVERHALNQSHTSRACANSGHFPDIEKADSVCQNISKVRNLQLFPIPDMILYLNYHYVGISVQFKSFFKTNSPCTMYIVNVTCLLYFDGNIGK